MLTLSSDFLIMTKPSIIFYLQFLKPFGIDTNKVSLTTADQMNKIIQVLMFPIKMIIGREDFECIHIKRRGR